MGRHRSAEMGHSTSSSSRCCNWPWQLYLLVILALVLSALNFWMNLYRHEQLRSEVSAFDEKLNETIQRMENLQFINDCFVAETDGPKARPRNQTTSCTGKPTGARLIYEVCGKMVAKLLIKALCIGVYFNFTFLPLSNYRMNTKRNW